MADLCQSFKLSTHNSQINVQCTRDKSAWILQPIAVTEKDNDHEDAGSWMIQLSVLLKKPDR